MNEKKNSPSKVVEENLCYYVHVDMRREETFYFLLVFLAK